MDMGIQFFMIDTLNGGGTRNLYSDGLIITLLQSVHNISGFTPFNN